jgi:dephospho-CoA kinase
MIVIGLTGSIGMGKTTTSEMFKSLGIPVISADAIVHDLYSSEAAPLIEAAFPGTTTDGVVDRQALSAKLMAAPEGFARLEAIIHPLVRAREKQFVDEAAGTWRTHGAARHSAAFRNRVDRPRRHCHCRQLCAGDPAPESHGKTGHDRGEIRGHRLARQTPDAEKRARADYVIDTGQGLDAARAQVNDIVAELTASSKQG